MLSPFLLIFLFMRRGGRGIRGRVSDVSASLLPDSEADTREVAGDCAEVGDCAPDASLGAAVGLAIVTRQ